VQFELLHGLPGILPYDDRTRLRAEQSWLPLRWRRIVQIRVFSPQPHRVGLSVAAIDLSENYAEQYYQGYYARSPKWFNFFGHIADCLVE